jgi:hypothetical protein
MLAVLKRISTPGGNCQKWKDGKLVNIRFVGVSVITQSIDLQ